MRVEVRNSCADFNSYRAARVKSLFNAESGADFSLDVDLPVDDQDWRIGVVVGPSGGAGGANGVAAGAVGAGLRHLGSPRPRNAALHPRLLLHIGEASGSRRRPSDRRAPVSQRTLRRRPNPRSEPRMASTDGETPQPQRRPTREDIPAVLEKVAEGNSLRAVCRSMGLHCPSTHTMIDDDEGWREQYVRARELRAETLQEDGLTVTRAAALGLKVGEHTVDAAGARAYLEALKWAAGRMAPKTAPVQRIDLTGEVRTLPDEELAARIAALEVARDELEA